MYGLHGNPWTGSCQPWSQGVANPVHKFWSPLPPFTLIFNMLPVHDLLLLQWSGPQGTDPDMEAKLPSVRAPEREGECTPAAGESGRRGHPFLPFALHPVLVILAACYHRAYPSPVTSRWATMAPLRVARVKGQVTNGPAHYRVHGVVVVSSSCRRRGPGLVSM
jgi:hypothetical protein